MTRQFFHSMLRILFFILPFAAANRILDFIHPSVNVGDGFGFVVRPAWRGILFTRRNVFRENSAETKSNERLDEIHLREKRERKIEDDKFRPMREKSENRQFFPCVRKIQKCRQKAHRRTHDADRRVDDDRLENHGMVSLRIEFSARQFERKRTSQRAFEQICEHEFNQHNRPNRKRSSENGDAAERVDRFDDAACAHAERARAGNERRAVQNVKAVKNIGMDGNQNRDEREHHSLKLVSRHFFLA